MKTRLAWAALALVGVLGVGGLWGVLAQIAAAPPAA